MSEVDSIADAAMQQSNVGTRSAAERVPFFVPHLRPGMSVLECGCGVGSITCDLAARVAPEPVVGIDVGEGQLAVARSEADRRGLNKVASNSRMRMSSRSPKARSTPCSPTLCWSICGIRRRCYGRCGACSSQVESPASPTTRPES